MTQETDKDSAATLQLGRHFEATNSPHDSVGDIAPPLSIKNFDGLLALVDDEQISPLVKIKILRKLLVARETELHEAHELIEQMGGEFATVSDALTQEREAREAAEVAQRLDGLTGLGNRRAFDESLAGILAEEETDDNKSTCIVFLDIDGLKQTNDCYGHVAGDKLLLTATKLFKERSRGGDELFRVGGDEVTLIMNGTPETIQKRILKMQTELENMTIRVQVGNEWKNIPVWGFSFGIHKIDRTSSVQDNYKASDASMYDNKRQRKEDQRDLRSARQVVMLEDAAKIQAHAAALTRGVPANDVLPAGGVATLQITPP